MIFTPLPHQQVMLDWLKANPRCALFSYMGSGKTSVCLQHVATLKQPTLIIAPKQVALNTWSSEIDKWDFTTKLGSTKLTSTIISGSPKGRTTSLGRITDIYIINYENLPWLVEYWGNKWPYKVVISDECTRLKGFRTRQGSVRAKALAKVIHTLVDNVILLTGTPAPRSLLDLWGQIWFLDKGERLGKSFSAFQEKWFYPDYSGYNWFPKTGAQEEIQKLLTDICITIKAEDWNPTDTPITIIKNAILSPKDRIAYKKMEKEMFLELETGGVEAFNAASKSMKCRQIAAGAIYDESSIGKITNYSYNLLHDEKIEVLKNIIEENSGQNILVAYYFKSDKERLLKAVPNCHVLGEEPNAVEKWNKGEIPIMLVNPASAGVGLNLQYGGNILVFFSSDWHLENHIQMIERIGPARQKQAGFDRSVFIYYILAKDTVDELIHERLKTKKEVQEVLLNAMNKFKRSEHHGNFS